TPSGGFHAHPLDVTRGCEAGLGAKRAREMPRAHVRASSHRLDGVARADVLDHQALHLTQAIAPRLLRCERGAELRLAARPAQAGRRPYTRPPRAWRALQRVRSTPRAPGPRTPPSTPLRRG